MPQRYGQTLGAQLTGPGLGQRRNDYQSGMTSHSAMTGIQWASQTVPTWGGSAPWGGAAAAARADFRRQRRLQAIDLAALFGAVAVLGSLFMPWYQFGYGVGGLSVSVSVTALSSQAGGWRWLMLACSLGVLAELLLTLLIFKARTRRAWPHRSLLALFCAVNLALVAAAMVFSPFGAAGRLGLLNSSLAAGAYVALVGAIVGVGAAVCRLVTGPPALCR
jgi:hypothetical protein